MFHFVYTYQAVSRSFNDVHIFRHRLCSERLPTRLPSVPSVLIYHITVGHPPFGVGMVYTPNKYKLIG